jgi:hypothetical protein
MVEMKMTRDEFNAKAAQLKAEQGIVLSGDKGEVSKEGVTVDYEFDGENFTAFIKHKPMLVTLAFCEGKLRSWLA